VRFGEPVHVYNNYYLHNTDVGVAFQANAGCMVEADYFENTEETVTSHYAGPTGRCVARSNVLVGESGPPDCSGAVQEPSAVLHTRWTTRTPSRPSSWRTQASARSDPERARGGAAAGGGGGRR
jgi:pectate lyase